jgi:hypothetical protein
MYLNVSTNDSLGRTEKERAEKSGDRIIILDLPLRQIVVIVTSAHVV